MNDGGSIANRAGAMALLALVGDLPRSGDELAEACGVDPASFRRLATMLWAAKLLQGDVMDGCCQDPCGVACVSAMHCSRHWQPSRKGRSMLGRAALDERTTMR